MPTKTEIEMKALPANRRQRGVTLIESCIVLAISTTAIGVVAPGLEQMCQRRHLEGASAQLETDLQLARSLAVSQNHGVRVDFSNANVCYVIHTGGAGACNCAADGSATCSATATALRVGTLGVGSRLTLHSNSASMLFDPVKGTVTPTGTVQIGSADGASVRTIINIMGRVRSCSVGLSGYKAC
jgi:type IV fimbrial biogenesis protein FimT